MKKITLVRVNRRSVTICERASIAPLCLRADRLYDCYTRCSTAKQQAYSDCMDLLTEVDEILFKVLGDIIYSANYGICSYNTMMFTFAADFKVKNNIVCQIYCTAKRTEIYVIPDLYDKFISAASYIYH